MSSGFVVLRRGGAVFYASNRAGYMQLQRSHGRRHDGLADFELLRALYSLSVKKTSIF